MLPPFALLIYCGCCLLLMQIQHFLHLFQITVFSAPRRTLSFLFAWSLLLWNIYRICWAWFTAVLHQLRVLEWIIDNKLWETIQGNSKVHRANMASLYFCTDDLTLWKWRLHWIHPLNTGFYWRNLWSHFSLSLYSSLSDFLFLLSSLFILILLLSAAFVSVYTCACVCGSGLAEAGKQVGERSWSDTW